MEDPIRHDTPTQDDYGFDKPISSTTEDATLSPPMACLSPNLTGEESIPQLDRSVSTASSVSGRSSSSRLSDSGIPGRPKRGYMRPQATTFSDSAKNRESVMSLGSIAHLQYYFARTGLLDGKGGQMAKKNMKIRVKNEDGTTRIATINIPGSADDLSLGSYEEEQVLDGSLQYSPVDTVGDQEWDRELAMLPPTVSTYNQRPAYVPPPPDLTMLRRELTEALEDALKVLKESDNKVDESQGYYEIQGLHLLDVTTLAIRAAKNYYTAHTQYDRLHAIKSEREIRQELYQVLEILKRLATRNFTGGLRQVEKVGILTWIVGISELIQSEIDQEKRDAEEREQWPWRQGDWTGREREREWLFIRSFIQDPDALPQWPAPAPADAPDSDQHPSAFLLHLQDGLHLVHLHNALVRKSKKQFEEIKSWHTDTNKPYRMADNLRFWLKAAQLRWELHLRLDDVMAVVQGSNMDAWRQFDAAILAWATGVRTELVAEMHAAKEGGSRRAAPPRLRIDSDHSKSVGSASSSSSSSSSATLIGLGVSNLPPSPLSPGIIKARVVKEEARRDMEEAQLKLVERQNVRVVTMEVSGLGMGGQGEVQQETGQQQEHEQEVQQQQS